MPAELIGTAVEAARVAIENLVRTRWIQPGGQLLTAVKFEDAPKLEAPGGAQLDREPDKLPWLRVDILWGDSFPTSFGPGALNRCVGVVQITLFYPKLMPTAPGSTGITQLADKARTIFSNVCQDGVLFQATSLPQRQDEDRWKVRILRTDFEFYEAATG